MLSKEALEKVAAADARDQAAAIEAGFEDACADMGLDRAHAEGLAKVARERLREFRKVAGEMLPARPPAEVSDVQNWMTTGTGEIRTLPNLGKPRAALPPRGTTRLGNVGAPKPALKPWAPPVPVPPMVTIPKKQPVAPAAVTVY